MAEFPPRRRTAGAIWPSLDLLEFVTHDPLPDSIHEDRLPDLFDAMGLTETTRHAVERHVAGLCNWMRGHLDWGSETSRYRSVEYTAAGVEPSYLERL
jgi:hypothetical protein